MKKLAFTAAEMLLFPVSILTGAWMKFLTTAGLPKTVFARRIFLSFGVWPVRDHYYNPLINPKKHLRRSLQQDRALPGIDFNDEEQLRLLTAFSYQDELRSFPLSPSSQTEKKFYYNNGVFMSGDAEYLYCMIRHFRPQRMIEIGSGSSTLIAREAFKKNQALDPNYSYELICVEPYEQPWLEKTGATIVREKVETMDKQLFQSLGEHDILFIDSSHMIRPQGDVLFEFLELLPTLKPGVLVHVHDIFTPQDYLEDWVVNQHVLWNEQYLLEAFLSHNDHFEIIGALNYLLHHHRESLLAQLPILKQQPDRQPGSFWIRKKI